MNRVLGPGMALLTGLGGGSALAMTIPTTPPIHCSVERGDKLPSGLSAESVCAVVRNAAAPALERAGLSLAVFSVQVTVDSDRKLSAAATLDGKPLPTHHVGISDRALNARAVQMLAKAIAAEIASARK